MTGTTGPKDQDSEQMGFVRKVLGIVSMQLFISFIILLGAAVETEPVSINRVGPIPIPTCEHGAAVISFRYDESGVALGCMNSFGYFCQTIGCQITSFLVYIMTICALL